MTSQTSIDNSARNLTTVSVKDPATVVVAGAVRAYAEQAGADVVAEGIETPDDLTRALVLVLVLVLGATLGQGWQTAPTPRPRRAPQR